MKAKGGCRKKEHGGRVQEGKNSQSRWSRAKDEDLCGRWWETKSEKANGGIRTQSSSWRNAGGGNDGKKKAKRKKKEAKEIGEMAGGKLKRDSVGGPRRGLHLASSLGAKIA